MSAIMPCVCDNDVPRFMHRGRRDGVRGLDEDSDAEEYLQSGSDGDNSPEWLEGGGETFAFHTVVPSKLAVRWLPPGSPAMLYQEYLGVQRLRNARAASCPSSALGQRSETRTHRNALRSDEKEEIRDSERGYECVDVGSHMLWPRNRRGGPPFSVPGNQGGTGFCTSGGSPRLPLNHGLGAGIRLSDGPALRVLGPS